MAGVRYPIEMVNGVPVVAAPEEIDVSNADWLRAVLLEAAARGRGDGGGPSRGCAPARPSHRPTPAPAPARPEGQSSPVLNARGADELAKHLEAAPSR